MINLMEHLIEKKIINLEKTVFFSRSIGCICSTYLSAIYKVRAMILYYPFYSIKGVVKSKLGALIASTIQENEEEEPIHFIQQNLNPTLIVQGEMDDLIDCSHAYKLQEKSKSYCQVKLIEDMGHEIESRIDHVVYPLRRFFKDYIYFND